MTDAQRLQACLMALRVLDRDVYIGPAELRRLLDSTARRIGGLGDVSLGSPAGGGANNTGSRSVSGLSKNHTPREATDETASRLAPEVRLLAPLHTRGASGNQTGPRFFLTRTTESDTKTRR